MKAVIFQQFFNLDDFTFKCDIGTVPVDIYFPSNGTTKKKE